LKLSADIIEQRLSHWPVARLATLNTSGQPHQVPIVFVWRAGKIWSPVDGKPKHGTPLSRVRNALANPAASILLDQYDEDWSQLWWLRVDVKLEIIYLDGANEITRSEAQEAIAGLKQKYPQYKTTAVLNEPPTLLAMTPIKYRSWRAK